MEEVQDKVERYQWIKGENFGDIVEVESSDSKFIYFTNGSKIFRQVSSEFLEKVVDGNIPLPGADKAAALINNTEAQNNQSANKFEPAQPIQTSETPAIEPSIMGKMIMKMSKKNVVSVPIQINLNIPTPQLYGMLSDGMEEDDLNEEIMAVALSQIEMDKLQEYIRTNVTDFLSEYYNNI